MGNPDKTIIFNESHVITIKGNAYNTNDECLDKAIAEFRKQAKESIDEWYRFEKENPENVVKDYDIQGAWEIRSINIYSN